MKNKLGDKRYPITVPEAVINSEGKDLYELFYTKSQVNEAIAGIDLTGYATKDFVAGSIADLVNGAPTTLDTLAEIADALAKNKDVVEALDAAIGNKANKSTTLAGYGITDAYTKAQIDSKVETVNTAITALDTKYSPVKTWYDALSSLIVVEDGNVRIKTNLIVEGDTASGGTGESTDAVGTVTGILVNGVTKSPTNGIIALDDYPTLAVHNALVTRVSALEGKTTAVSFSQTLTGGKQIGVLTIDGSSKVLYAPSGYAWSEITGKPTFATVATSGNYNDLTNKPTIPTVPTKLSQFTDDVVAGKYLSLNGGTISGRLNVTDINGYTPITGGNIGSQSVNQANYIPYTSRAADGAGYAQFAQYHGADDNPTNDWYSHILMNHANSNGYYTEIAACFHSDAVYFRRKAAGTVYGWKQFAFTDSSITGNAASATKLATARTIWGQNFDGTGNVSGALTGVTDITASGVLTAASVAASYIIKSDEFYIGSGTLGVSSASALVYTYGTTPIQLYTNAARRLTVRYDGITEVTAGLNVTASANADNGGVSGVAGVFLRAEGGIEISHASTPYIDFHYTNATGDYSARLICRGDKQLTLHGDFRPYATNSYGLGSSGYRWYNVYTNRINASGNADISGALTVGAGATVNGNLIVTGDTGTGSDIRFKDIIRDETIEIKRIAEAPLFTFRWNDREDDTVHLGSSAQYWEGIAPWLVSGTNFKTLNYAALGVAMGISVAKKTLNLEERIEVLERENKTLKAELRRV